MRGWQVYVCMWVCGVSGHVWCDCVCICVGVCMLHHVSESEVCMHVLCVFHIWVVGALYPHVMGYVCMHMLHA